PAPTRPYTLSLHDALPICGADILSLAEHFLARACADHGVAPKTLTAGARAALLAHPWPGNVREVGNLMERVALLSLDAEVTPERSEEHTSELQSRGHLVCR